MKKIEKQKCINCDDFEYVSTDIPCPHCTGNGINEIVALRDLADYVYKNYWSTGKPPKELVNKIRRAQNKSLLK